MIGEEKIMPRPIRDQIIVTKEKDIEQSSPGGIVIVRAEERNASGTVLAVGSGRMTSNGNVIPLEVQVGDKVLFNKNVATEVKDGDKIVLVLREDNIICVL